MKKAGRLPVNFKVILEGEEEVGSEHLGPYVKAHAGDLAADVVLISDSEMFDRGVPSLCYGLRGLTYMQIDLRGTKGDLHSGQYGGAVANPANMLAHIIAQLRDKSGNIKIPGFYDDVRALREEERAEFRRLPFDEKAVKKQLGAPRLAGERGYSMLERMWARPTLDVNASCRAGRARAARRSSRHGDGQGQHAVGAEPASREDRRAVRGLREEDRAEDGRSEGDAPARRVSLDDGLRQRLRAGSRRALEKGFGKRPVFTREGGSIPIVTDFQAALNVPVVLFGFGLPDDNLHAPNEKFNLDNFFNGVLASAFLYQEIAEARG